MQEGLVIFDLPQHQNLNWVVELMFLANEVNRRSVSPTAP